MHNVLASMESELTREIQQILTLTHQFLGMPAALNQFTWFNYGCTVGVRCAPNNPIYKNTDPNYNFSQKGKPSPQKT
jgi:hypothetical protein